MFWYYADGEERRGPVETAVLVDLLNKRAINLQTLVWREGLADWLPLEKVRAQLTGPAGPGGAGLEHACIECGRSFPESELARINQLYVCAECKGAFLQKLAQGDAPGGAGTLFRKGNQVVTPLEAFFPERCVKCDGAPAGRQFKRTLYWHHPAIYLIFLFPGLLFYLIVAMAVRKRATVHVSLCAEHRARRVRLIVIAWLLVALGVGLIALAIFLASSSSDYVMIPVLGAVASMIAAVTVAMIGSSIVKAARIDTKNAYLRGAGEKFLGQLPAWPEP